VNALFITYSRIGDAVLSTGLLAALISRHPFIRLTIACGPAAAPLFDAAPNVDRVIVMTKRKAGMHWADLWRACLTIRWDLIVDLRDSPVSRLLPAKSRRLIRRGHNHLHRVERLASVLDADSPPPPQLWITRPHMATARKLVPGYDPVLALGPTANWPGKQWDGLRFAELAHRLTGATAILPGAKVAILGADSERAEAEQVLRLIPAQQRVDLVGKIDLLTAYAVLRRCSLFIGNDSGLMHIAAAAGIPTLGLFGPSRETHYAPWGLRTATVRTRLDYEELVGSPGYDHRTTPSLMGSLSIGDAEAAAIRLWNRHGDKAA
jgi:ADP-heptose:LPS heptosyltransferase